MASRYRNAMKKTEFIMVRVTPAQKELIRERAGKLGISEYLRRLGMGDTWGAQPAGRPEAKSSEDPDETRRRRLEEVGEKARRALRDEWGDEGKEGGAR